ncbi:hypothetical protein D3C81_1505640 [compost metagenome]
MSPFNFHIAIFGQADQIAGTVETVLIKGGGVVLRTLVITAEGIGATGHQTPGFPHRQRVAVLIGHPQLVIRRHRAALSGQNMLIVIVQTGVVHQAFRHAEHLLQLAADLGRNTCRQGFAQLGAAHLQQLKAGQLLATAPLFNRL